MKILFLCPYDDARADAVLRRVRADGDDITKTTARLSPTEAARYDLGIVYGYEHLLPPEILAVCRFVNLHISYLPWNRGDIPNVWSWIDHTPKGVSIHLIDNGIDTGPIYCQSLVTMDGNETLTSSYKKLGDAMNLLFANNWSGIRNGDLVPVEQSDRGTIHTLRDRSQIAHILENGWDIPVSNLEDYAAEVGMSAQFWQQSEAEIEALRTKKKLSK